MFRKNLNPRIVLIIIVMAAASAFLLNASRAKDASHKALSAAGAVNAQSVLKVATLEAEYSLSYVVEQSYIGRVEARREAAVGFEIGGLVNAVYVSEGDAVAKDDIIAQLDTKLLDASRAELAAAYDQAAADAALAKSTLKRFRKARALNAVSEQALDEAEKDANAKRAASRRAAAAVKSIDVRIEKAQLRAPFDAIVAARLYDEGRVVEAGGPILHLLERGAFEARIGIAGSLMSDLKIGATANVTIGGASYVGVVSAVLPVRNRTSRSVDAIIALDVDDQSIRQGDLAQLDIGAEINEGGYWLPLTALTESTRGLWAAYVAEPGANGVAEIRRRDLEILHQETDRVFVRGTLRPGDRVVSTGVQRLAPGLIVSIENSSQDIAAAVEEGFAQ